MNNRDKYTYLGLMALGMFGVGFWMMSVGGGLGSKPPAVPNPMAASQNVGSQFTGALTFGEGNEEIDAFFEKNFLMPDDFAKIGAVDGARALRRASCLEDESVVRNYLRPNESAFYISAAEDLTAREMIKRVEPVEFFYWMLHFDSESNRWSELGTEVISDNSVNSVVEEKLDEYVVKAGEPVLVYIFGMRTDEDVEMRLQDGQLERQVIIKHCENSFPDDVFELSDGWNLTVADLVPIASDPKAQNAFAIDFLEGVSAVNLNGVQALANQFEGVLNWVLYDSSVDREGFDIENSNLPRIVFDLLSDPEVDTSGADEMLTIAEFELLPFNSPNIASITLEALNLGGVNFDQLFENVAFKINDRFVGSATDLVSDMLVMPVNLNSDDIFSANPATLKIMATPAARLAVENLVLKLSLDLQSQRVASTIMPPLMIEFESILAKTALVDPNDAIELNDLNLPPSATGFNLNVEIANDTSNQVSISDIRIPILSVEGLESLNMIEGPNLLATSADLDEVEARVAFDDKNIYLFPGREVNLSRKQKRMLSLSFFFDHDDINDLNLEFGPIEMNTNSVNYKVLDSGEVLTWSGGSVGQTTDSESNTDSDSDENLGSTTTGESDTDGDGDGLPSFGNDTTTDSESNTDSESDENPGSTTTREGVTYGDSLPSFGRETTTDSESDTDSDSDSEFESNENEGEADQDGQEQNEQQGPIVPEFNPDSNIVIRLNENQQSDRFNWVYSEEFSEELAPRMSAGQDLYGSYIFRTSQTLPLYLGNLSLEEDLEVTQVRLFGSGSENLEALSVRNIPLDDSWSYFDGNVFINPLNFFDTLYLYSVFLEIEVENEEFDNIHIELPSLMAMASRSEFSDVSSYYRPGETILVGDLAGEYSLLEYERLVPDEEDNIDLIDTAISLPEIDGLSVKRYFHSIRENADEAEPLLLNTDRRPGRYIEYLNVSFDDIAFADFENGDVLEIRVVIADEAYDYRFIFGSTFNQEPSLPRFDLEDGEDSNEEEESTEDSGPALPRFDLEDEGDDSSGSENVSDKRLSKLEDDPEFQKMLDKLDEGRLVKSMLSSVNDLDDLIALLKAEGLGNWVEYVSQYR